MKPETLIAKVQDLRAPSPSVAKLMTLLRNPNRDNADVVQVIKYDTVLTAKLLAACNSACYGLAQPIDSLERAVLHLGSREIYRLVLSLDLGAALRRELAGYAIGKDELWRHSLTTAFLAECLAAGPCAAVADASVAYTAGLLHDIGKLAFNQALNEPTQNAILGLIERSGQSRLAAERAVLETDHAEVGACLLRRWKLSDTLVEAVANHHRPLLRPRPRASAIVHVANCLAHEIGSAPGWAAHAMAADERAAKALGLDSEAIQRLLITAYEKLQVVEDMVAIG
jgi:putative nucleotidyltransferase with HDIG domain